MYEWSENEVTLPCLADLLNLALQVQSPAVHFPIQLIKQQVC